MRPAALALLTVLAALVMLGAATSTWATVSVPTPPVDGVQLPDTTVEHSGAAVVPGSVVAAVLGFLTALPLALVGVADRVSGPAAGRAVRAVATLLATATAIAATAATTGGFSVEVVTLGGGSQPTPTISGTAAPGILALAALVVLAAALLSWRVPRHSSPQSGKPSRYTVEAVTGETPHPPPTDEDADEWDLAVAVDPTVPGEER